MMLMAAAGAAIAVQAPLNAALSRNLDSPVAAAAVSFGVGFVVLVLIALLMGEVGAFSRVSGAPVWLLCGGALGAFYVWSALWSVPVLGVLTTTSLLILGQLIAALVLDSIGAFGLAPRDISMPRLFAAALVATGAVLSRF